MAYYWLSPTIPCLTHNSSSYNLVFFYRKHNMLLWALCFIHTGLAFMGYQLRVVATFSDIFKFMCFTKIAFLLVCIFFIINLEISSGISSIILLNIFPSILWCFFCFLSSNTIEVWFTLGLSTLFLSKLQTLHSFWFFLTEFLPCLLNHMPLFLRRSFAHL